MWQDTLQQAETTVAGFDGWTWLVSFHGLLSLFFLGAIIFAAVALFHDWRQENAARTHPGSAEGNIRPNPFLPGGAPRKPTDLNYRPPDSAPPK